MKLYITHFIHVSGSLLMLAMTQLRMRITPQCHVFQEGALLV